MGFRTVSCSLSLRGSVGPSLMGAAGLVVWFRWPTGGQALRVLAFAFGCFYDTLVQ